MSNSKQLVLGLAVLGLAGTLVVGCDGDEKRGARDGATDAVIPPAVDSGQPDKGGAASDVAIDMAAAEVAISLKPDGGQGPTLDGAAGEAGGPGPGVDGGAGSDVGVDKPSADVAIDANADGGQRPSLDGAAPDAGDAASQTEAGELVLGVTRGATVPLSCFEGDICQQGYGTTVDGTTLDMCNYSKSLRQLDLRFIGLKGSLGINIDDFTGTGTYTTSGADDTTTYVQLGGDSDDMPSVAWSGAVRCTITAVSDDLANLQPAVFNLALYVSCPALEVGSVCAGTCQPVSFTVSVAGCQAWP